MLNKYEIARQVEIEDLRNAMEFVGVDVKSINDETMGAMYDSVYDKLAEDDVYNECYNSAIFETLKEFGVEVE